MPTRTVIKDGKIVGYKWGDSGKIYLVSIYGRLKAERLADQGKGRKVKKLSRARPKSHLRKYKDGNQVRVNGGIKYTGKKPIKKRNRKKKKKKTLPNSFILKGY